MFNLDPNYLKRSKSILPADSVYPSRQLREYEYYTEKYPQKQLRSHRSQDDLLYYHYVHKEIPHSETKHSSETKHLRKSRSAGHIHYDANSDYPKENNNILRKNSFSQYMDGSAQSKPGSNFIVSSESYSSSEDSYNSTDPPILWTTNSVYTLDKIMKQINNTKLMKPLGYMVRYYINKHQPNNTENRISTVDKIHINRESLILATICEIYLKKNRPKTKIMISNKLIYRTLGKIIHEIIDDNFTYDDWVLTFEEAYMINLVTEVITGQNNNDKIREIIKSSYYVTKYLITIIESEDTNILSTMNTLLTHSHSLDIASLLTNTQIRELMRIMNVTRRLYLRIFLLISHHMVRYKSIVNTKWTKQITTVKNMFQFQTMLTDDVMELIIIITGVNLQ